MATKDPLHTSSKGAKPTATAKRKTEKPFDNISEYAPDLETRPTITRSAQVEKLPAKRSAARSNLTSAYSIAQAIENSRNLNAPSADQEDQEDQVATPAKRRGRGRSKAAATAATAAAADSAAAASASGSTAGTATKKRKAPVSTVDEALAAAAAEPIKDVAMTVSVKQPDGSRVREQITIDDHTLSAIVSGYIEDYGTLINDIIDNSNDRILVEQRLAEILTRFRGLFVSEARNFFYTMLYCAPKVLFFMMRFDDIRQIYLQERDLVEELDLHRKLIIANEEYAQAVKEYDAYLQRQLEMYGSDAFFKTKKRAFTTDDVARMERQQEYERLLDLGLEVPESLMRAIAEDYDKLERARQSNFSAVAERLAQNRGLEDELEAGDITLNLNADSAVFADASGSSDGGGSDSSDSSDSSDGEYGHDYGAIATGVDGADTNADADYDYDYDDDDYDDDDDDYDDDDDDFESEVKPKSKFKAKSKSKSTSKTKAKTKTKVSSATNAEGVAEGNEQNQGKPKRRRVVTTPYKPYVVKVRNFSTCTHVLNHLALTSTTGPMNLRMLRADMPERFVRRPNQVVRPQTFEVRRHIDSLANFVEQDRRAIQSSFASLVANQLRLRSIFGDRVKRFNLSDPRFFDRWLCLERADQPCFILFIGASIEIRHNGIRRFVFRQDKVNNKYLVLNGIDFRTDELPREKWKHIAKVVKTGSIAEDDNESRDKRPNIITPDKIGDYELLYIKL